MEQALATGGPESAARAMAAAARAIHEDDIAMCRRIGEAGAKLIPDGATLLTHCNTRAVQLVIAARYSPRSSSLLRPPPSTASCPQGDPGKHGADMPAPVDISLDSDCADASETPKSPASYGPNFSRGVVAGQIRHCGVPTGAGSAEKPSPRRPPHARHRLSSRIS